GLVPPALPAEDAGVVGAADVEQEDVVAAAEVADTATPLGRSFVIPHALTGGDQIAAGPGNAVQQPRLAVECHRGGLVEPAHTLVQLAVAHQRSAFESEPEHLQLGGAERAP